MTIIDHTNFPGCGYKFVNFSLVGLSKFIYAKSTETSERLCRSLFRGCLPVRLNQVNIFSFIFQNWNHKNWQSLICLPFKGAPAQTALIDTNTRSNKTARRFFLPPSSSATCTNKNSESENVLFAVCIQASS